MAMYFALRGWIECGFELAGDVRSIVDAYFTQAEHFDVRPDQVEGLRDCWRFPTREGPAELFVFLGAYAKVHLLPFFEAQLRAIAESVMEIDGPDIYHIKGRFEVSNEHYQENHIWRIKDGALDTSGGAPWSLF